jgi:membrane associated rhomboid family serine protease
MSSGADLFVVCKQCGSEVSPYITECPYCGSRLRKRAPKLEKARKQEERRRRRADAPRLGRLRSGEIPGIRPDTRPYATIGLVVLSVVASALVQLGKPFHAGDVVIVGGLGNAWWRVFTAPFVYINTGYMLVALTAAMLFGWLLERRHGPLVPLLIFITAGAAGMALAASVDTLGATVVSGGNGAALALLCAWAVPDLAARRRGEDTDSDLLGVAVIAGVLLLLPVAVPEADPLAGLAGVVVGFALGFPLAALSRGR